MHGDFILNYFQASEAANAAKWGWSPPALSRKSSWLRSGCVLAGARVVTHCSRPLSLSRLRVARGCGAPQPLGPSACAQQSRSCSAQTVAGAVVLLGPCSFQIQIVFIALSSLSWVVCCVSAGVHSAFRFRSWAFARGAVGVALCGSFSGADSLDFTE